MDEKKEFSADFTLTELHLKSCIIESDKESFIMPSKACCLFVLINIRYIKKD